MSLFEAVGTGVITGDKLLTVFETARKHGFAIPAYVTVCFSI